MSMIRVIYAIDECTGPTGGTETQFLTLLDNLDLSIVEPRILVFRQSDFLEKRFPHIPVYCVGINSLARMSSLAKVIRAARWARNVRANLVHTILNDVSVVLPLPLRLFRIPVVVSRRDEGFWHTTLVLGILRLNKRFVSCVLANSNAVAKSVIEQEGYPPSKVEVIRNHVQLDDNDRRMTESEWRGRIPCPAFVVGIVANLRPLKKVGEAIRAIAEFGSNEDCPYLVVAGEDRDGENGASHLGELRDLADELGISSHVIFLGFLLDTNNFYKELDVGLSCSSTEGMSNSLLECMAVGRPVIASDIPASNQLLNASGGGLSYKAGDSQNLATKIRQLRDNCSERHALGLRAKEYIRKNHGLKYILPALYAIYERHGEFSNQSARTDRSIGSNIQRPGVSNTVARWATCKYPRILVYHRFGSGTDGRQLGITEFRHQLDILERNCTVLPLSELVAEMGRRRRRLGKPLATITIDDGYSEIYQDVYPVLESRGIRPTLFITSGFICGDVQPWPDMLRLLLAAAQKRCYELSSFWGEISIRWSTDSERDVVWRKLAGQLIYQNLMTRMTALEDLRRSLELEWTDLSWKGYETVSWSEIRTMQKSGFEIGDHSFSHPCLPTMSEEEICAELTRSRNTIAEKVGVRPCGHAYPNGTRFDYNKTCMRVLRDLGYSHAVLSTPTQSRISNKFEIGRFSGHVDMSEFERIVFGQRLVSQNLLSPISSAANRKRDSA